MKFVPENVLDKEQWSELKRSCAEVYGVNQALLKHLFAILCCPTSESWGTVELEAMWGRVNPRVHRLFRRMTLLQAGKGAKRMLFEDTARLLFDVCALDFPSLVRVCTRAVHPSSTVTVASLRAVLRFVTQDKLDWFQLFLLRHLFPHPSSEEHEFSAWLHLAICYPVLPFPFLELQRAIRFHFGGGVEFWKQHAIQTNTFLFPPMMSLADARAISARVFSISLSVGPEAAPCQLGSEETAHKATLPRNEELSIRRPARASRRHKTQGTRSPDRQPREAFVHRDDAARSPSLPLDESYRVRSVSDASPTPVVRLDALVHVPASPDTNQPATRSRTKLQGNDSDEEETALASRTTAVLPDAPPPLETDRLSIARRVIRHFVSGIGMSDTFVRSQCLRCGNEILDSLGNTASSLASDHHREREGRRVSRSHSGSPRQSARQSARGSGAWSLRRFRLPSSAGTRRTASTDPTNDDGADGAAHMPSRGRMDITFTGICKECDWLIHVLMVRTMGYREARRIEEAATVQPTRTSELTALLAEKRGDNGSVRAILRQRRWCNGFAGMMFHRGRFFVCVPWQGLLDDDGDNFVKVHDPILRQTFYYDVATGAYKL